MSDVANRDASRVFEVVTEDCPRLFREHPFSDPPAVFRRVRELLAGTALEGALDG